MLEQMMHDDYGLPAIINLELRIKEIFQVARIVNKTYRKKNKPETFIYEIVNTLDEHNLCIKSITQINNFILKHIKNEYDLEGNKTYHKTTDGCGIIQNHYTCIYDSQNRLINRTYY